MIRNPCLRLILFAALLAILFTPALGLAKERTAQSPLAELSASEVELRMPGHRSMPLTVLHSDVHANGDRSIQAVSKDGGWQLQATLGSAGSFGMLHGEGTDWLLGTDQDGFWVQAIPRSGVSINSCGLTDAHIHAQTPQRHTSPSPERTATRTIIDVLLVYNQAMSERYPGPLLETRFNHLIAIGNQTFANSGIDLALRLVATDFYDYPNDTSNFDFRNDLARALGGERVPTLDGLAFRRDQLGADLVIGLRPHDILTRGSCGIAFFPDGDASIGVNVVSDGVSSWSFCLDDVLTHEVGHNLGATHQLGAGGGVVDPRGSAFIQPGRFTTVMGSFGTGQDDRFRGLAMFSNPDLNCGGEPCGNLLDGDNRRVIERFMDDVAAYRTARGGRPLPPNFRRDSSDSDADGVSDWDDALPFNRDEQLDRDRDGTGDGADAFPDDPSEQTDSDQDRIGDVRDRDDDNDGFLDQEDVFPLDPQEWSDADLDGYGDNGDRFPNDASEWRDSDGDGQGDQADPDADDDGAVDRPAGREDLLVVSAGNGQILRFDARNGTFRGVEVPAWDSRITFQSALAYRPADDTLLYTGDSGLRRLNLLSRELLGEWVPPFANGGPSAPVLGTGFPVALAASGERVAVARLGNPSVASFKGQAQARSDFSVAWQIAADDAVSALSADDRGGLYLLGGTRRSLYRTNESSIIQLSGPNTPWMRDPRYLIRDGERLFVSDRGRNAIFVVAAASGELLGELADMGALGYHDPAGLALGPDNTLLVAAEREHAVLAFDRDSGAFLGERITAAQGGLSAPGALLSVPAWGDRFPRNAQRVLAPNAGLWFNPERSGRGFDLQQVGDRLAVLWYGYDDDGLPSWLLASGTLEGFEFSAPLERFHRAPDGSTTARVVGTLKLSFESEQRAQLQLALANETLRETVQWFAISPFVNERNETGVYGRDDGPGWGISLDHQADTRVTVAYLYDAEGEPRWLISEPRIGSEDSPYQMLASFSDSLCISCSGPARNELVPAGTLSLALEGPGRWLNDLTLPAPLNGRWTTDSTARRFSDAAERPR